MSGSDSTHRRTTSSPCSAPPSTSDELHDAIGKSLLTSPTPALTLRQRVVLEALRGYDDTTLVSAAPHIHDLLRHHQPDR